MNWRAAAIRRLVGAKSLEVQRPSDSRCKRAAHRRDEADSFNHGAAELVSDMALFIGRTSSGEPTLSGALR
jgi:hypothetical protein